MGPPNEGDFGDTASVLISEAVFRDLFLVGMLSLSQRVLILEIVLLSGVGNVLMLWERECLLEGEVSL